jgi:hypothetical protein
MPVVKIRKGFCENIKKALLMGIVTAYHAALAV